MIETTAQRQTMSRALVWRSLGMLRAVRGLVVVSFLLGVIASALPYISAAAFGPMMQVVADAGTHGTLSRVWDLQGPVLATDDDLIGSLAGPVVPFAVLLGDLAAADSADVLRQRLGQREGRPDVGNGHSPAGA